MKMAGAKTDADLDEIWKEHEAVAESLFPPDQDRAQFSIRAVREAAEGYGVGRC